MPAQRLIPLLISALATVMVGCAADERAVDVSADIAAINAVNEGLLEALNSGDWQQLNALTDDEYVYVVNGTPTSGRANIDAGNRGFLEQWEDEEAWLPDETMIDGDLGFQRGSFTMRLSPRDGSGPARDLAGTYMHLYQRRQDGSWALTRAMAQSATD